MTCRFQRQEIRIVRQTSPGRRRLLGLCVCLLSAALFLLAAAFKPPSAAEAHGFAAPVQVIVTAIQR